jgi:hypothetical protein
MTIRYAFLMIFATDISHVKRTFHKQFIHLHTFDYFLRSEMFLKNCFPLLLSLVRENFFCLFFKIIPFFFYMIWDPNGNSQ